MNIFQQVFAKANLNANMKKNSENIDLNLLDQSKLYEKDRPRPILKNSTTTKKTTRKPLEIEKGRNVEKTTSNIRIKKSTTQNDDENNEIIEKQKKLEQLNMKLQQLENNLSNLKMQNQKLKSKNKELEQTIKTSEENSMKICQDIIDIKESFDEEIDEKVETWEFQFYELKFEIEERKKSVQQ